MSKNTEVLERLAALEAKIGHNGGPPLDDNEPTLPPKHKPVLISDRQVAERYDVVVRTVERWDRQPELGFPLAVRINRRRFRVLAELEEWDRNILRRAAPRRAVVQTAAAAVKLVTKGAKPRREKAAARDVCEVP